MYLTGNKKNIDAQGFVLLFAILISSVVLAVGMGMYNITLQELQLSKVGRESQKAFYMADTGAECAFYWDRKYPGFTDSVFAYFGESKVLDNTIDIKCGGEDIRLSGGDANPTLHTAWKYPLVAPAYDDVDHTVTNDDISTQFIVNADSANWATTPCARVTVEKKKCGDSPSMFIQTTITSEGFSVCDFSNSSQAINRTFTNTYPESCN